MSEIIPREFGGALSLFHARDQVRIDELRMVQIKALLKTFNGAKLSEWLIWWEDATDWQPLRTAARSLLDQSPSSATEDEASSHSLEDVTPSREGSEKALSRTGSSSDARKIPRIAKVIDVVLDAGSKLYKNQTVDVSIGGFQLRYPIELPAGTQVTVVMTHQKTDLVMLCRVLGSPNETERRRILIVNCNRMDILRAWILTA